MKGNKLKTRLEDSPARINTRVREQTRKNLRIVAAETDRTLEATVDYLVELGVQQYLRLQKGKES